MSKAAAKREIDQIMFLYGKPWDVIPAATEERLHELKLIAYPGGIPLPRI